MSFEEIVVFMQVRTAGRYKIMTILVSRLFLKKIYFSLMSLMCWLSTLTNTTNTIFNKTNSSTSQLPTEDCQMGRSGLTGLFFSYIISFFKKKSGMVTTQHVFFTFFYFLPPAHIFQVWSVNKTTAKTLSTLRFV